MKHITGAPKLKRQRREGDMALSNIVSKLSREREREKGYLVMYVLEGWQSWRYLYSPVVLDGLQLTCSPNWSDPGASILTPLDLVPHSTLICTNGTHCLVAHSLESKLIKQIEIRTNLTFQKNFKIFESMSEYHLVWKISYHGTKCSSHDVSNDRKRMVIFSVLLMTT